jgi:hypothetical protein
MPSTSSLLEVQVYLADSEEVIEFECQYVSLVNQATYGAPPLVAPTKDSDVPRAKLDDGVLYINTALVPMWMIKRVKDA